MSVTGTIRLGSAPKILITKKRRGLFLHQKIEIDFFWCGSEHTKKTKIRPQTQLVTFALPHTRSDSIHTQAQDKCEKHDKNKGATTSTEQNYFSLTRAPARHDLIHS